MSQLRGWFTPPSRPREEVKKLNPCRALIRRAQPISNSGFSQDELRTFRIGFDLLPELTHIHPQILRVGQFIPQLLEDRKSTRLNSSHDQISYAVFCLKKKK